MRQFVFYSAALVAVYLLVSHATGAGKVIGAAGNTYAQGIRALQGRR